MRAFLATAVLAVAFFAAPASAQTDATLTASEYVARGLPPIDRDWTPGDYTAASQMLNQLPIAQLPHTNSEKSGAVLDRIVNRSSIAPCQNPSVDLIQRMQVCAPALGAISTILLHYSMAMTPQDVSRGEDNIRIMNYCMLIAAELSTMMTEFVATLDPSAADYSYRVNAIGRARGGLAQMIEGAIMSLEAAPGPFPENARVDAARTLAEVYGRMIQNVTPETRTSLDARIRAVAQTDRNESVRAALAAFAT